MPGEPRESPLTPDEEKRQRAYVAAAKREVGLTPGGMFELANRLFATLDAERAQWDSLSARAIEAEARAAALPPVAPDGADLRDALVAAIGTGDGQGGLPHWHHATGGTGDSPIENERDGVFVDRQQVLDAIERVLR